MIFKQVKIKIDLRKINWTAEMRTSLNEEENNVAIMHFKLI